MLFKKYYLILQLKTTVISTIKNNIKVVCSTEQTEYLAEQFRKRYYPKKKMTSNRNDPKEEKKKKKCMVCVTILTTNIQAIGRMYYPHNNTP